MIRKMVLFPGGQSKQMLAVSNPVQLIDIGHVSLDDEFIACCERFAIEYGEARDGSSKHVTTYARVRNLGEFSEFEAILRQLTLPGFFVESSWLQVYQEREGFHRPHDHQGADLAGSLYVTAGDGTTFQSLYDLAAWNTLEVESGDVAYWPGTWIHGAFPSPQRRIVLAFNLRAEG